METKQLKKVTAATTVAAAVIGATGFSNVAHADEIESQEPNNETSQTTASEQKTITESDVNEAKDTMEDAKQEAADKDQAVEDAKTELDEAQNNTSEAKEDLDAATDAADEATDEAIEEAEQNVDDAKQEVTEASEEHDNAHQNSDEAAAEKDKAESDLESAQQEKEKAEAESNQAEQNVEDAQNDISEAENAVTEATNNVNDLEEQAKQKEKELQEIEKQQQEAAEKAKAEEEAKQAAKEELDAAKDDQSEKQTTVDEAQKEVDDQKQVVSDAEKETQKAKDNLANANQTAKAPETIELSQEWVDTFLAFKNEKDAAKKAQLKQKLDSMSTAEVEKNKEAFKNNSLGTEPKYDLNNLDEQTQMELNLYFVALLNSIHEQLNDSKTAHANTNTIKFANDVAKEYEKAAGAERGHNIDAINTAASKNGLVTSGFNPYENLNYDMVFSTTVSEYDLYSMIFNTVLNMMQGDGNSNYAHAISLTNETNFGLSFDSYEGAVEGLYDVEIHIVSVPSANFVAESGDRQEIFDTKYGENSEANLKSDKNDTSALQAAVNEAVKHENSEREKLAQLESELKDAQDDYAKATAAVEKAQAEYDKLMSAPTESNKLDQQHKEVSDQLSEIQAKLTDARVAETKAKDNLNDKMEALSNAITAANEAKDTLDAKKQALLTAQIAYDNAVEKDENARQALKDAEKNLDKAHQKLHVAQLVLDSLQNAGANLEAAQKAYDEALAKQNEAEDKYNTAVTASEDAHKALEEATKEYNRIYSEYLLQQTIENGKDKPSQGGNGNAMVNPPEQGQNGSTAKPGAPGTSGVVTETVNGGNTVENIVTLPKPTVEFTSETKLGKGYVAGPKLETVDGEETDLHYAAALPQTGSKDDSLLSMIGLSILTMMMAVVPFRRQKHEK